MVGLGGLYLGDGRKRGTIPWEELAASGKPCVACLPCLDSSACTIRSMHVRVCIVHFEKRGSTSRFRLCSGSKRHPTLFGLVNQFWSVVRTLRLLDSAFLALLLA